MQEASAGLCKQSPGLPAEDNTAEINARKRRHAELSDEEETTGLNVQVDTGITTEMAAYKEFTVETFTRDGDDFDLLSWWRGAGMALPMLKGLVRWAFSV